MTIHKIWMLKRKILSTIYQHPHYNERYIFYRLNPPYIYNEMMENDNSKSPRINEIEDTELLINIQHIYQENF
jgi:hypothetical protein